MLPALQEAQRPRLAPPPLAARLAKPEPPAPVLPKVEPPALPAAKPRPAPAPRAVPEPARVPAPADRVLSVETPQRPIESPAVAPAAPMASPKLASQPPAVAPLPVTSGPDPGSIAQFRLELMNLARRYKRYPRIAQENNWQGRVELRIVIGESGALSSITVKKGAGRAVLDDEAQAMIRTASSKATVPPGLRGKAFTLEIAVDFFLKDEEK